MNDSRLFFGMANGIEIVEFTEQPSLEIDGRVFLNEQFFSLLLCDTLLFAGTATGQLISFEVIDGRTLHYLGELHTHSYLVKGIFERDGILFVAASSRLKIVDATDPANMVLLGEFDTGYGAGSVQSPRDVVVDGNVAYVVSDDIWAIDITDYSSPSLLFVQPTPELAVDLKLRDSLLFVCCNSSSSPSAGSFFQVYSVASDDSLELVSSLFTDASILDVSLAGDRAYLSLQNSSAAIVDIADPANPAIVGCFPHLGMTYEVQPRGNLAYVLNHGPTPSIDFFQFPVCDSLSITIDSSVYTMADTGSFAVFDVSDPAVLVPMAATRFSGNLVDVAVGEHAIVAVDDGWGFIHVAAKTANISDAEFTRIRLSDTPEIPTHIIDVSIQGDYAFLADAFIGLRVVDISDPASPRLAGTLPFSGWTNGVTVDGERAIVANGSNGVWFVDITDPNEMTIISHCATGDFALESVIYGNYAYVADRFRGMKIIDFSDIQSPKVIGEYDSPHVSNVALQDDLLAVNGWGRIYLFSIQENPSAPTMVGNYLPRAEARNSMFCGHMLVLSHIDDGIEVVDVSNPAQPELLAFKSTPGYPEGLAFLENNSVIIADKYSLLQYNLPILTDVPDGDELGMVIPTSFSLAVYPNPFNSSTTIELSLARAGDVRVAVLNVLGEVVAVLTEGYASSGSMRLTWDGRNSGGAPVSTGVYFVRAHADGEISTRKMLYLK